MPVSAVSLSGAGTTIEYEDQATPGTYIELVNAVSIGATGNQGSFIDNSPISSIDKTYIAGDREPEDKELKMNDVPGDTDQEDFLALADARTTVNMRVTFSTGRIASFAMAMNGYKRDEPARDAALMVSVFGKRTGPVVWSSVA